MVICSVKVSLQQSSSNPHNNSKGNKSSYFYFCLPSSHIYLPFRLLPPTYPSIPPHRPSSHTNLITVPETPTIRASYQPNSLQYQHFKMAFTYLLESTKSEPSRISNPLYLRPSTMQYPSASDGRRGSCCPERCGPSCLMGL